jgi:hypothetical protein
MKTTTRRVLAIAGLIVLGGIASQVYSQRSDRPRGPGQGRGRGFHGGRNSDTQFAVDRDDFHFLLENHKKIRRQVTNTKDGVESLTESDSPAVADRLQKHVRAMYERVENKRVIRMRDPLYVEIFRHADKIDMKFEDTEKGIRVIEKSSDPYVVSLIQEHARVVSGFAKHGFDEAHKNHAIPGKKLADADQLAGCRVGGSKGCCAGKRQSGRQAAEEASSKGKCKDGKCNDGKCKGGECKDEKCKDGKCKDGKGEDEKCKDGKCKDGKCKDGKCEDSKGGK